MPRVGNDGENAPKRSNSWGGARNRRDRLSDRITLDQAHAQIAAAAHAVRIGLPLNRHCTVHWERQGLSDAEAGQATRVFLKAAGDFLRTRGLPFAWIYQRENGPSKGSHVHILMHVPSTAKRAFLARQRRWVRIASGHAYYRRSLRSTAIGGAQQLTDAYTLNLSYLLGYTLKGLAMADALALGLCRKPNPDGVQSSVWGEGGTICGKRVGRSQNLGSAARRAK